MLKRYWYEMCLPVVNKKKMGVAYFIRYKNNEKITPLLAKLAKMSGGYHYKIQRNEIHVFFDQG